MNKPSTHTIPNEALETGSDMTRNRQQQKRFGHYGLIFFIILLNVFAPLSTDMYLPALPTLNDYFATTEALVNLSLTIYFAFYCVGILLWGPFSDKFGRRPTLIINSLLFAGASILCACSANIYLLIFSRIWQGVGVGGMLTVSVAIVKDCFSGRMRSQVLSFVSAMTVIAPIVAPVLGGILLLVAEWQVVFVILAAFGLLSLLFSLLYCETLPEAERNRGPLRNSWAQLAVVGRRPGFIIPAILCSLQMAAFLSYLQLSSYIYIDFFGLSEQQYSYFFAASALGAIFGPLTYARWLYRWNKGFVGLLSFALASVTGLLMLFFGALAPFAFWLAYTLFGFLHSAMRPYSLDLLLAQQEGDTGSASSLINALGTLCGVIGMMTVTLWGGNHIFSLSLYILVSSLLALIGWAIFLRSPIPCIGLRKDRP